MQGILVVTEGDTEDLFYKSLISTICTRGQAKILYKKVGGIGNFFSKRRKIAKYIRDFSQKLDGGEVEVVLCFDNDVYEPQGGRLQATNPPPNPDELRALLEKAGASTVYFLTPTRTIEDWIILDCEGVFEHLNLPKKTKLKGNNGLSKLENLYKLKKKVYNKNAKDVQLLVEHLDMDVILGALPINAKSVLTKIFDKA